MSAAHRYDTSVDRARPDICCTSIHTYHIAPPDQSSKPMHSSPSLAPQVLSHPPSPIAHGCSLAVRSGVLLLRTHSTAHLNRSRRCQELYHGRAWPALPTPTRALGLGRWAAPRRRGAPRPPQAALSAQAASRCCQSEVEALAVPAVDSAGHAGQRRTIPSCSRSRPGLWRSGQLDGRWRAQWGVAAAAV